MAKTKARRGSSGRMNGSSNDLTVGKLEDGPRIGPGALARKVSSDCSKNAGMGMGRPPVSRMSRYSEG